MKQIKFMALAALIIGAFQLAGAKDAKLSGSVLGSNASQAANAFDSKTNTYFKGTTPWNYSYVRNWVGLDLGSKHVITKVGIMPANGHSGDVRFAVVQGANNADFSDALPLTVYKNDLTEGDINYIDIDVSRGFRYLRVMATNSAGYFAEVEFYGEQGEGDNSKFYQLTNLPLVSFNTPGDAQIMSKDDKHPDSYVAIVSEGGTKILEDGAAQMKGRGNGSWTFPKKPFQIKFNKKQQPLDAPAKAKKWTLINNYGDRTLMRNKVAFDMSRMAGMPFTPYCTFVDVIYNGSYEGAYQLCDQVEVNPGRVEVTEMAVTDTDGDNLTGGYFIEIDAYADQEISWFKSNKGIPVTIKSPEDDAITAEQTQYIKNYFNQFESALFGKDYTDHEKGYRKYLDVESFLRYFILCELNGNIDSWWSTYMWKERGDDQLHVGPIWDIDLGFQNVGENQQVYDIDKLTDYIYTCPKASLASSAMKDLVTRIVKEDPEAKALMSEIWSDLRHKHNFNAEYFNAKIDEYAEMLNESQTLNFKRWPILNQSVQKGQKIWGSYEGEVGNIKDYLTKRVPRLDSFIGLLEPEPDNIIFFEDFDNTAMGDLPLGWSNDNLPMTFITYDASMGGTEPYSGENCLFVNSSWNGDNDFIVFTPQIPLKKGEKCTFTVMVKTKAQAAPNTYKIKAGHEATREGQIVTLVTEVGKEFGEWTKLKGEFTPDTEEYWCFSINVLNPKEFSSYVYFDDVTVYGELGHVTGHDTTTGVKVPYTESFDNENKNYDGTTYVPAYWVSTGDSPFVTAAVSDLEAHGGKYYLFSDQSENERNERLYTPLLKLEAGKSYCLSYSIHLDPLTASANGGFIDVAFTAGTEQDAEFHTVELDRITETHHNGWDERSVYFVPDESGEYCFAWHLTGPALSGYAAIDDFSIFEKDSPIMPKAAFCVDHIFESTTRNLAVFDGHAATFRNLSSEADSYDWTVEPEAGIDAADAAHASICFPSEGTYKVTLTAKNENGADELSRYFDVTFFDRDNQRNVALSNRGNDDKMLARGSVPAYSTNTRDYITGPNHYYRTYAQLVRMPDDHNVKLEKIGVTNTDLRYKPVNNNYTDQYNQAFEIGIYPSKDGKPDLENRLGGKVTTMSKAFGTLGIGSQYGNDKEFELDEPVAVEGDIFVVVKFADGFDIDIEDQAAGSSYAALAALKRNFNHPTLFALPYALPDGSEAKVGEWCDLADIDATKAGYAVALTLWVNHNDNTDALEAFDIDGNATFAATLVNGKLVVSGVAEGDNVVVADILGRVLASGRSAGQPLSIALPSAAKGVVVVAAPSGTLKTIIK